LWEDLFWQFEDIIQMGQEVWTGLCGATVPSTDTGIAFDVTRKVKLEVGQGLYFILEVSGASYPSALENPGIFLLGQTRSLLQG